MFVKCCVFIEKFCEYLCYILCLFVVCVLFTKWAGTGARFGHPAGGGSERAFRGGPKFIILPSTTALQSCTLLTKWAGTPFGGFFWGGAAGPAKRRKFIPGIDNRENNKIIHEH